MVEDGPDAERTKPAGALFLERGRRARRASKFSFRDDTRKKQIHKRRRQNRPNAKARNAPRSAKTLQTEPLEILKKWNVE